MYDSPPDDLDATVSQTAQLLPRTSGVRDTRPNALRHKHERRNCRVACSSL